MSRLQVQQLWIEQLQFAVNVLLATIQQFLLEIRTS